MDIYHPDVMPRSPQEIPREFQKMCWQLSQDVDLPRCESDEELIAFMIKDLDAREKAVIADYIRALFTLKLSDRELLRVSFHAGSSMWMLGEEGIVKEFFGLVCSTLEPS
jgi:hypothetical protein